MTFFVLALALFAQASSEPSGEADEAAAAGQITKQQAEAALAKCGIRRFEASAEGLIDGKKRRTSIRLCATDSESDAEWLAKLEKSAVQVEAQPRLPDNVKSKLLAELRTEIEQVKVRRPSIGAISYSLPKSEVAVPLPREVESRAAEREPAIVALPPLPPRVSGAAAATSAVTMPTPKLSIRCHAPGLPPAGVQCDYLTTDTVLVVSALDALPANSILRFRRVSGGPQEDVALPRGLVKGAAIRVKVPKPICARVFRTEFDIAVVTASGSSVADLHGPFATRC